MHILCCIEDAIKTCLERIETDVTVVCDKMYCWCIPQDINNKKCGINVYVTSESVQDTARTIGGNYRCGLGVIDAEINFTIEIYALHCEDSKVNAKNCLGEVNKSLCEHHSEIPVVTLEYLGFSLESEQNGEEHFTVIEALYSAKYRLDLCKPNVSRIACSTLNTL